MKLCPVCSRVYADPSLNFCLDDGAKLAPGAGRTLPAEGRASDTPTEVLPQGGQGTRAAGEPTLPASPFGRPAPLYDAAASSSPREAANGSGRKWLLAVLAVVLLSGGVGLGLILTSAGDEETRAGDSAGVNETKAPATPTPGSTATPEPTQAATPAATPSATATPEPTPDLSRARSEVMSVMESWAESLRRQDVSGNLRLYAERLDAYYQRGSVSREQVRSDRQAIFSKFYSSTDVQLDNISIELDPTGTEARVTYDNSYNWRGGPKFLAGKSRNAMTLSKTGSRWLITSEIHLKDYGERSN